MVRLRVGVCIRVSLGVLIGIGLEEMEERMLVAIAAVHGGVARDRERKDIDACNQQYDGDNFEQRTHSN